MLVVSACDGVTREAEEHVRLARWAGVPQVVVFVNKADLQDDPELRNVTEAEVGSCCAGTGTWEPRCPSCSAPR
ncbi:GTP-binding protein [Streptomyces abikoensis]|uniref:GTP-binding protein n=1 Tax=Streptomyces abikoensis TaxID=97398 RepID=UPI0033E0112B